MRPPDVVIVGAGVVGASVAWHLRRLGVRDVLLLERESAPGLGSTSRATGGFRAQFATEINVRLSLLSREKLLRFREETGVDPGFAQHGYLWIANTQEQRAQLEAAQEVQRAAGLTEARMVEPGEIAGLNPHIAIDGAVGAAWCPSDGFIRPLEILRGYLREERVRTGSRVVGLRRGASGRIEAVRTQEGEIAAGCVVDAAGAWAGEVARLAQVNLPVAPLRRQVGSTVACDALPAEMPMTIWTEDGFHLRVRDGRVLLLWPAPADPRDAGSTAVDPEWLAEVGRKAAGRVPPLAGVPLDPVRSWAGLYEMSPDKHALLGRSAECENLFFANGSSGHGVMHAPALGQLLAEIIVHGAAGALDVRALRPSRFAEGQPNPMHDLL
jgi:sarcosine oxidase subunit beta